MGVLLGGMADTNLLELLVADQVAEGTQTNLCVLQKLFHHAE